MFSPDKLIEYMSDFKNMEINSENYNKGTNSILITSVHGFDHLRHEKIKYKDSGSLMFAFLLSKVIGANFAFIGKPGQIDNNNYPNTDFKKMLKCKAIENEFKLIIDIHGSHAFRISDIEIGTMNHRTCDENITSNLIKKIENYRFLYTENEIFSGLGEPGAETMTNFSFNELKTNAMQLEINSSIMNVRDETDIVFWHKYCQLLNCIAHFVEEGYN